MSFTHPKNVGGYHLLKQIGQGGLADVFLAIRNGEPFAVKCLKPERKKEERFVKDFVREAKISTTLRHPNILKFSDQGQMEDTYFAVMELIVGTALDKVLSDAKRGGELLPLGMTLYVVREVCQALKCLHQSTVFAYSNSVLFHGDISPGNVMICQDGRVLLMDFGSAGQQSDTYPKDHHLGKMYYLPPDVLQKKPYTTASDIYSLGVLTFYLLFGIRPFEAESNLELYRTILNGTLPRPDCSAIGRGMKDEGPIRIFFNKALHKDSKLRFQTVEEFEKHFFALHFSAQAPTSPSGFLSLFPSRLTQEFNATAEDWMSKIKDYRAGDMRAVENKGGEAPVKSLLAKIDLRKHPRAPIEQAKLEAEIVSVEEKVKVVVPITELSRGGMLVKWEGVPPHVGKDYPIKLKLKKDAAPIQVTGRLIYEIQRKEKPFVGFQFSHITPENQNQLTDFVFEYLKSTGVIAQDTSSTPTHTESYVDVVFKSLEEFRMEFETNIRHGGMFVQSTKSFRNDDVVLLRIQIGSHLEKVTIKGRVVYCKSLETDSAPNPLFGVGLQLSDPIDQLFKSFQKHLPATP